MVRKGYIIRLAMSWFILSGGFLMAFAGFVLETALFWLIGTTLCMLGAGAVAYTEMRRLTDRLGKEP